MSGDLFGYVSAAMVWLTIVTDTGMDDGRRGFYLSMTENALTAVASARTELHNVALVRTGWTEEDARNAVDMVLATVDLDLNSARRMLLDGGTPLALIAELADRLAGLSGMLSFMGIHPIPPVGSQVTLPLPPPLGWEPA